MVGGGNQVKMERQGATCARLRDFRMIMMGERETLVAFCVLVGAICYLATVAAVLAWQGKYVEALGFGGITTGLVGVLGAFRPKAPLSTTGGDPVRGPEVEG